MALKPDAKGEYAFGHFRSIHWGWGLEGVRTVLTRAVAECEKTGDTRRGSRHPK